MRISRTIISIGLALAAALALSFTAQAQSKSNDFQRILSSKTVRVGAVEAPPWYHQDLKTHKWTGIVPDISELIFGSIGVKVQYVPTQWGTAVAGLQSGKFDLIGAYNITPQRALVIDFTDPIGGGNIGFITFKKSAAKYKTWNSLNNPSVKIVAVDGAGSTTTAHKYAPKASWTMVPSNDAMFLELQSGRVDVAVTNQGTLVLYQQSKGAQKSNSTIIYPEPILGTVTNFGLRKSSDELRNWINAALEYFKANGSLHEIWEKYLPSNPQ